MNKKLIIFLLTLSFSSIIKAQMTDFVLSILLKLDFENKGFSFCSEFNNSEKFKLLFQLNKICYYKCSFDNSGSDSIIICSRIIPSVESQIYEISIFLYFHDLKDGNEEYFKIVEDLRHKFSSDSDLFKSRDFKNFNPYINDSINLTKRNCSEDVAHSFSVISPLIFGFITQILICLKNIYKISIVINGSLLKKRC